MTFSTTFDFLGNVDVDVFEQAVRTVIADHPLLGCVFESSPSGLVWRSVSTSNVFRHRREMRLPGRHPTPIEPLDLSAASGVRVELISTDDGRWRVDAHYHHGCVDGQGAMRFLRDVFVVYAAIIDGHSFALRVSSEGLQDRGLFAVPPGERPIGIVEGMRNLWTTVRGKNARFPPMEDGDANGLAGSHVVELMVDSGLDAKARALAERGYTLNDLALAATFLVLAGTELCSQEDRYLSILNPVDLRSWGDRRLPAANRIGLAFLRRRHSNCCSARELLESVTNQMKYVRRRGVAAELMKGVSLVENVPGLLAFIERTKRFVPTATLTSMTNLRLGRRYGMTQDEQGWRLGGALVENSSGFAPLPAGVPLAIAIIDCVGPLSITMRGCNRHFNEESLHSLARRWRMELEVLCQQYE